MSLDSKKQSIFYNNIVNGFSNDEQFFNRLNAQFPLYGLRWSMIMLNVFLTDYKSFRKNDDNLKARQLRKVNILLERINNHQIELKNIIS